MVSRRTVGWTVPPDRAVAPRGRPTHITIGFISFVAWTLDLILQPMCQLTRTPGSRTNQFRLRRPRLGRASHRGSERREKVGGWPKLTNPLNMIRLARRFWAAPSAGPLLGSPERVRPGWKLSARRPVKQLPARASGFRRSRSAESIPKASREKAVRAVRAGRAAGWSRRAGRCVPGIVWPGRLGTARLWARDLCP